MQQLLEFNARSQTVELWTMDVCYCKGRGHVVSRVYSSRCVFKVGYFRHSVGLDHKQLSYGLWMSLILWTRSECGTFVTLQVKSGVLS